jgi:hypothetical protein
MRLCELQAESDRLRMDAVAAADGRRELMLVGPALDGGLRGGFDLLRVPAKSGVTPPAPRFREISD